MQSKDSKTFWEANKNILERVKATDRYITERYGRDVMYLYTSKGDPVIFTKERVGFQVREEA